MNELEIKILANKSASNGPYVFECKTHMEESASRMKNMLHGCRVPVSTSNLRTLFSCQSPDMDVTWICTTHV